MFNEQVPASGRQTSRGQVIVGTAILMALIFISLTAAGYAAFSSADKAVAGPPDYTSQTDTQLTQAEYVMETALIAVNHDTSISSATDREQAAEQAIRDAVAGVDGAQQFSGSAVSIEYAQYKGTNTVTGTRVVQNNDSRFIAAGATSYTLTTAADQHDQATFELNPVDLPTSSDPPFEVVVSGSETTTIAVYQDGLTTVVDYGSGQCTVDSPDGVTLDVVDGTLNGRSCGDYDPPATVSEIRINNGDQATGNLSVVALGSPGTVASPASGSSPVTTPPPAGTAGGDSTGRFPAHHVVYGVPVEVTVATDQTTTTRLVIVTMGDTARPLP